ncbi:head-tail adaptor protein [Aurantimonas sp. A2-1-M11]|uniref:head-tail adaptor protein n=1 Tax=Aurantimonas sp. A2-1-M11 TaxID=3113712 RepID=UPI002F93FC40
MAKPTTAGQLKHRLSFRSPVSVPDGYGGTTDGFAEQFVVSARRQFLRGSEAVQAARLEGRQPVILTVRRSPDTETITTDWQAVDAREGTAYQIRSVEPTEDRAWLDMLCESGVAQ